MVAQAFSNNQGTEQAKSPQENATLPPVNRRGFLEQIAAVAAILSGGASSAAASVLTAQDSAPGAEKKPGIDTPLSMGKFEKREYFLSDKGNRVEISDSKPGFYQSITKAGVVLAVALSLDQIAGTDRSKVEAGRNLEVTIAGFDRATGQQTSYRVSIDPTKIPQSEKINPRTFEAAVNADEGLKALVEALSDRKDSQKLGIGVQVQIQPDKSSGSFEFQYAVGRSPADIKVQLVQAK